MLVLDTTGSPAALRFGFDYERLAVLSLVVYGLTGFLAPAPRTSWGSGASVARPPPRST